MSSGRCFATHQFWNLHEFYYISSKQDLILPQMWMLYVKTKCQNRSQTPKKNMVVNVSWWYTNNQKNWKVSPVFKHHLHLYLSSLFVQKFLRGQTSRHIFKTWSLFFILIEVFHFLAPWQSSCEGRGGNGSFFEMAIVCGSVSSYLCVFDHKRAWGGVWFHGYFDSSQAGKSFSDDCEKIRGDRVDGRSPAARRSEEVQLQPQPLYESTNHSDNFFSPACLKKIFSQRILNGTDYGLRGFV